MSDLVTDGLVTLVTALITMVGVAVILVVMDWQLALATLVVAPLIALAARSWRGWSADAYRQVRETHSVVTVQLQESLSGVRAIQSFRRERATAARLEEANHAERVAHWRTIGLASFFFPGIEFLGTVHPDGSASAPASPLPIRIAGSSRGDRSQALAAAAAATQPVAPTASNACIGVSTDSNARIAMQPAPAPARSHA